MDVSAATGAISVGGNTNDASLRGSAPNSQFYPFVVFYEPEKLQRKWEKYADLATGQVKSVGFSPNGNELFAFF